MPNGISHPYQLHKSNSVLRVVGLYDLFFFSNVEAHFCEQTVVEPDQLSHCETSDLVLQRLQMDG